MALVCGHRYIGIMERLIEPERMVAFRVAWVDDAGKQQAHFVHHSTASVLLADTCGVVWSVAAWTLLRVTVRRLLNGARIGVWSCFRARQLARMHSQTARGSHCGAARADQPRLPRPVQQRDRPV